MDAATRVAGWLTVSEVSTGCNRRASLMRMMPNDAVESMRLRTDVVVIGANRAGAAAAGELMSFLGIPEGGAS